MIESIKNRLPLTKFRLAAAQVIYKSIRPFVNQPKLIIKRNGLQYEVNISEGIDLSLFLFGHFQKNIIDHRYFRIPKDAVIFDVGANIGSMALPLAQLVENGKVYAFEPTDYAFEKLLRNIELNQKIKDRINPIKLFISSKTEEDHDLKAYSSWKIDGSSATTHPLHGGAIMPATVDAISLDDFCRQNNLQRVDFIKIDTDGYEAEILQGARMVLENFQPVVVFEVGLYILEEFGIEFPFFTDFFSALNYRLIVSDTGRSVTDSNYHNLIPRKTTVDLIAINDETNE